MSDRKAIVDGMREAAKLCDDHAIGRVGDTSTCYALAVAIRKAADKIVPDARALLSGTATEGDGWQLTFAALRDANVARQAEWCPDQLPDLSFRGNELAGEAGEACNIIKKLERERHGWRGSRATTDDLLQELADVVICADLTAIQIGADLGRAVAAKFNATSTKHNLSVSLPAPPAPPAEAGEG